MGSWLTFSVGDDQPARQVRLQVLRAFFESGGGMIDSSPMYGTSEEVIGYSLARIADTRTLFAATKVWTPLQWYGVRQMQRSERLWGQGPFDLMQVHNLWSWEAHLETLLKLKADGRIRYIGVTTSHGRRHQELAKIMASAPIDFVQFTYNVLDREAACSTVSNAIRCRRGRRGSIAPTGLSSFSSSSSPIRPSPAPSRRHPGSITCAKTWARPGAACRMRKPAGA
jgi:diketogulonate reductase-like aldo/keto reductase